MLCMLVILVGNGAGGGIRTPDPLITNQMLYQLSYTGFFDCRSTDDSY